MIHLDDLAKAFYLKNENKPIEESLLDPACGEIQPTDSAASCELANWRKSAHKNLDRSIATPLSPTCCRR